MVQILAPVHLGLGQFLVELSKTDDTNGVAVRLLKCLESRLIFPESTVLFLAHAKSHNYTDPLVFSSEETNVEVGVVTLPLDQLDAFSRV